jgi:hexosaminidase
MARIMRKNFSLPVLCFVLLLAISAVVAQQPALNIVPKPVSVKFLDGKFELNSHTKIIAHDEAGRYNGLLLNNYLAKVYGFNLKYQEAGKNVKNAIIFLSQTSASKDVPAEAYTINITKEGVKIAGRDAGQFYALQSFLQMLPPKLDAGKAVLPAVDIADQPRFRYRGMHLDVGRHFMPVTFLKKYLDLMAQYKFNYFHWHLTDDQGWRIEIKKYPKLTEVGGYRKETVKDRQLNPYVGDNFPHGGFYTQEQVKEIVAYAKALHITVIPEIEMPGHSAAAIAAYPELACKEDKYEVATTWGIFKQTYCPKENTFKFLENVLTEVVALFPDSPYIHVGGDEVLKDQWKESALVQELKQNEKLKDENEVQSYFIRRMEKFINSKGKRIIGWDEILEGGIAPDATIMSWRGIKGGIEAAKAHHDVIMTPTDYCYFDFYQGDPRTEPLNIGGYLPLEKVYSFDPVPVALSADEAKYIIGGQANVWTEYIPGPDKVEYMVFPRLLALSEKLWSPAETTDYKDFTARLPYQLARLDKQNIGYRIPEPAGLKNVILAEDQRATEVTLGSLPNSRLYYTLDGSEPSEFSTIYNAPVKISLQPHSSVVLKTIVVTENGRKSSTYSAVITNRKMLAASSVDPKIEGMTYSLYNGIFNSIQIMDGIEPALKGETKIFALRQFNRKENFGVIWDAYIKVPEDGLYDFAIDSDDGAALLIDDQTIVDNDGIHTRKTVSDDVPLAKGFHKIRVKYFQKDGEMLLNLRWCIKGRNWLGLSGLYH